MSEITTVEAEEDNHRNDIIPPKNKMQSIFESLEVMALQKGKGGMDINSFSSEQKDKLLDILAKNEDNAFTYHTKKLEVTKDISLAHINSSTVTQRTKRYTILGSLFVGSFVTVLILILKEQFFIHWLTFITGIFGGIGIGRYSKESKEIEKKAIDNDDDD